MEYVAIASIISMIVGYCIGRLVSNKTTTTKSGVLIITRDEEGTYFSLGISPEDANDIPNKNEVIFDVLDSRK